MARPLYSVQLWADENGTSGDTSFFSEVVPDGSVWVVRDLEVGNAHASSVVLQGILFWLNTPGDPSVPLFNVPWGSSWGGKTFRWRGRQVLPAGSSIGCFCYETEWSWVLSGYQLTAP